jgi:hypothetical protein
MDKFECLKCKKSFPLWKKTEINFGNGLEPICICGKCSYTFGEKLKNKDWNFNIKYYKLFISASVRGNRIPHHRYGR